MTCRRLVSLMPPLLQSSWDDDDMNTLSVCVFIAAGPSGQGSEASWWPGVPSALNGPGRATAEQQRCVRPGAHVSSGAGVTGRTQPRHPAGTAGTRHPGTGHPGPPYNAVQWGGAIHRSEQTYSVHSTTDSDLSRYSKDFGSLFTILSHFRMAEQLNNITLSFWSFSI